MTIVTICLILIVVVAVYAAVRFLKDKAAQKAFVRFLIGSAIFTSLVIFITTGGWVGLIVWFAIGLVIIFLMKE